MIEKHTLMELLIKKSVIIVIIKIFLKYTAATWCS